MLRATTVIRRPDMSGKIAVDTITLDRASRWRRRVALKTDHGADMLLDLADATYLADGDGLLLETMGVVTVIAAAEPLLKIHAHSAPALARIAWHIGNRHTACEITSDALYIQPDHVLEEMVIGLGAHVHHVTRPFEPEGGAYGGKGPLQESHHGHPHAADHAHGQDHKHPHTHDRKD
jgi:urease accessory protein